MPLRMFDAENEGIARIHAQLQHHAEVQRRLPLRVGSSDVPTRQMLADLLDVAFWASLTTNEGRPTRVRIALLPAGSVGEVLAFKHPVPYTEDEVAKLAPAASSTGSIAVDLTQPPGTVWGISTNQLHDRFGVITLGVSDPGVIRVAFGPFHSFIVFAGRSTITPDAARDAGLTAWLGNVLGKELATPNVADGSTALRECLALGGLARMVLEDRHGGTLLVVPDRNGAWLDSLEPFTHQFLQADRSIRDSILAAQHREVLGAGALTGLPQTDVSENVREAMLAAFSQVHWHPESVLRPIASLAAVDGAVVLTADLNVLGFGAMISVGSVPDVYLVNSRPEATKKIHIEEAGGARHQSAVRFVGQHRQSISLVISHDGHLSLSHWSAEHNGVLLLKNAEWWL
jgi:Probable sensor domain DACNV